MSRFDDLSKQIFKENKFLIETSQDLYDSIEDDIVEEDGTKKIIKTREEIINELKKSIEGNDFPEIDGLVILNKIVLNKMISKNTYDKLREFVATDPRMFLLNDFLIDKFNILFQQIFKEVIFDGRNVDLVMIDLRTMLKISIVYITMFEERIKELKKK